MYSKAVNINNRQVTMDNYQLLETDFRIKVPCDFNKKY